MMTFHSALWHSILEYVSLDKMKFSCIFWHSILDDNVTFCMIKYDSSWYSILNDNILFWSKELKEKIESTSLVFWRCFKKPFNEKSLLSHLLVLHSIDRTLYCAVKQSVILYSLIFPHVTFFLAVDIVPIYDHPVHNTDRKKLDLTGDFSCLKEAILQSSLRET